MKGGKQLCIYERQREVFETNLGRTIDTEEQVSVDNVMGTMERGLDIREDELIDCKLRRLLCLLEHLKVEQFAICHDDQIHLVSCNELVEQHRMYPRRLEIVDRLTNCMLDYFVAFVACYMNRLVILMVQMEKH